MTTTQQGDSPMDMAHIMAGFYGLCADCTDEFAAWWVFEDTSPGAFLHSATIRQHCLAEHATFTARPVID